MPQPVTPDSPPAPSNERTTVRWYVMRAYKQERLAESLLSTHGIQHFIAKRYALRTYHGHKQRHLVPAIPSIIFVRSDRGTIHAFKDQYPILQYVMSRYEGSTRFVTVPDDQMRDFMRVATQVEQDIIYFSPDEIDLHKGMRVRVHGGAFDGIQGTLVKVKGKRRRRVVIHIDDVASIAAAEIEPDLIEIIE